MKVLHFDKQIVQAHRGASGYKHQNTTDAFDLAVEMKADAIELDIRKTLDGKIVVVHDPTLHEKKINDLTYEELLVESKKDDFIIPLFIDVLKKYKGKILLDIEIKETGYTKEIIDMILSVLTYDEFNIRSFHDEVLKEIKLLDKNIYTILLIGREKVRHGIFSRIAEMFPNKRVKKCLCDCVSPNWQLIRCFYVQRMHMIKKPVLAWTVNDKDLMKKMLFKKHVDGIVTNYPDVGLAIRDNK